MTINIDTIVASDEFKVVNAMLGWTNTNRMRANVLRSGLCVIFDSIFLSDVFCSECNVFTLEDGMTAAHVVLDGEYSEFAQMVADVVVRFYLDESDACPHFVSCSVSLLYGSVARADNHG